MIQVDFFNYSRLRRNGKSVAWKCSIFGIPVIGSSWPEPEDILPSDMFSSKYLSLYELGGVKELPCSASIRETLDGQWNFPLLKAILGKEVSREKEVEHKEVSRLGETCLIRKIVSKAGYQTLMPLFYYRKEIKYSVSGYEGISDIAFTRKSWEGRNDVTDNEIINAAIEMTALADELNFD